MLKYLRAIRRGAGYKQLNTQDSEYQGPNVFSPVTYKSEPRVFSKASHVMLLFITVLVSITVGFLGGRNLPKASFSGLLLEPAGHIKTTWHYNKTFSNSPSETSEAAWISIFPRGRGFFTHPRYEGNISGIAVFHELHCLSGIRLAYYQALNKTHEMRNNLRNEDAVIDAANAHNDPHHIRHCFDYLRQALMCAADTNIERIDWKLGGSTGWGFERKCRDYTDVVKWAEKWRVHSQVNIS